MDYKLWVKAFIAICIVNAIAITIIAVRAINALAS